LAIPHEPPPQAEAPQPPWGIPQLSSAEAPEEDETAKVESCFSTSALAQRGQEAASPQRRTSFSNFWEQSAQMYS